VSSAIRFSVGATVPVPSDPCSVRNDDGRTPSADSGPGPPRRLEVLPWPWVTAASAAAASSPESDRGTPAADAVESSG
jgi:hypothetical protein